jgi:hypothetical protein
VDLNEGVVDSDDIDTAIGDTGRDVRMLFVLANSRPTKTVDTDAGMSKSTYALRKT